MPCHVSIAVTWERIEGMSTIITLATKKSITSMFKLFARNATQKETIDSVKRPIANTGMSSARRIPLSSPVEGAFA